MAHSGFGGSHDLLGHDRQRQAAFHEHLRVSETAWKQFLTGKFRGLQETGRPGNTLKRLPTCLPDKKCPLKSQQGSVYLLTRYPVDADGVNFSHILLCLAAPLCSKGKKGDGRPRNVTAVTCIFRETHGGGGNGVHTRAKLHTIVTSHGLREAGILRRAALMALLPPGTPRGPGSGGRSPYTGTPATMELGSHGPLELEPACTLGSGQPWVVRTSPTQLGWFLFFNVCIMDKSTL